MTLCSGGEGLSRTLCEDSMEGPFCMYVNLKTLEKI